MLDLAYRLLQRRPDSSLYLPGTAFYGDSIGHAIALHMPEPIHRLTQPGDTAQNAWRRFSLDKRHSKTVVLQHGTNDLTLGLDPVPYLRLMAEHAMAEGRRVVLTGILPRLDMDTSAVNLNIGIMAGEVGCQYLSEFMFIRIAHADVIHPDDASAKHLAEYLVKELATHAP